MYNPNSAIERVKNHLAYKLGQALIDFKQNGGGYIALFKKLYKIKKQHKKEQQIYQQTIQIFPQLKYPSLETCPDYNESLRYKFHLSYMLGEVLIKADMNKFKDGYFFLFKNIEQTKKDYKIIKEILDLSKKFEENIYIILAENKNLFMCNLDNLKIILDLHKNYIPALKVIFQNFNYTLNHLEMIQEWLLSSDFKQRFQDVNHPYPSLLDPKKLNDQAEKINYHNISGELAWKMNLPLPENYKLIWLRLDGSGSVAYKKFFKLCNVNIVNIDHDAHLGKIAYYQSYINLIKHRNDFNMIVISEYFDDEVDKFCKLISKKVSAICNVRDQIERIKHGLNHLCDWTCDSNIKEISLYSNVEQLFPPLKYLDIDIIENKIVYTYSKKPSLKYIYDYIRKDGWRYIGVNFHKRDFKIQHALENITYIDMNAISSKNCFDTFIKLSLKFGFSKPSVKDRYKFENRINNNTGEFMHLPVILNIFNENDFDMSINTIKVIITLVQRVDKIDDFINITNELYDGVLEHKDLVLLISKIDYQRLMLYDNLMAKAKIFLSDYIKHLNEWNKNIQNNHINIQDIFSFFKYNVDLMKEIKQSLDLSLINLKFQNPEIIESWKYYQKFEQMCNET